MKISFTITKRKFAVAVIAVVLSVFITIGFADGVIPGSDQDPLVTLSFVDKKIEQMKYYIDSLNQGINDEISKYSILIAEYEEKLKQKDAEIQELRTKVENALTYKVVQLQKGQMLIAGEGAEIIVRSGKTTALYGEKGGLSDVTAAKDLKGGEAIVNNHMLISSRGDGRGLKAESEVYLIIKGGYTLK